MTLANSVADILADLAAGEPEVQASNGTVRAAGRRVGLTASGVRAGLRHLQRSGRIEKVHQGYQGSPTVWRLNTL